MSAEGDDEGPRRIPKRARVTLKFESPPLLLPGEEEEAISLRDTTDLALPEDAPAPAEVAASEPAQEGGEDAWTRQRPLSSLPRKPTTLPPPPPLDDADEGGALDLVDRRSRPSSPMVDLSDEMIDRYALGDYSAALRIAELILGRDADHDAAARTAKSCRDRLGQLYLSRLGALSRVPHVAVDAAEIKWLGLDHRAAFLLSRVDGVQSLGDLLDVSGMPRVEALKTLVELLDMGAIGFDD